MGSSAKLDWKLKLFSKGGILKYLNNLYRPTLTLLWHGLCTKN